MRKVRKRIWIPTVTLLVLILLLIGTQKLMNSRSFQFYGGIINHVQTDEKVVALTFDDGPSGNVKQLLPVLAQYNEDDNVESGA